MTKETTVQVGPGMITMLTVAFVVLKLTGHIDWSWLTIILAPLWIPLLIMGVLLAALGLGALCMLCIALFVAGLEWVFARKS